MFLLNTLTTFFIVQSVIAVHPSALFNSIDMYEKCCKKSHYAADFAKSCDQSFETIMSSENFDSPEINDRCRSTFVDCCEKYRKEALCDHGTKLALEQFDRSNNESTQCSWNKIITDLPYAKYAKHIFKCCLTCEIGIKHDKKCSPYAENYDEQKAFMTCCDSSRMQAPCGYGFVSNPDFPEHSKVECLDINECVDNVKRHDCGSKTCVNLIGSYRCVDLECPSGYKTNPESGACEHDEYVKNCDSAEEDEHCLKALGHYLYKEVINKELVFYTGYNLTRFPATIYSFEINSTDSNFVFDLAKVNSKASHKGLDHIVLAKKNFHVTLQTQRTNTHTQCNIVLAKPLTGPQDINITVTVDYLDSRSVSAVSKHNLFVFISPAYYLENLH